MVGSWNKIRTTSYRIFMMKEAKHVGTSQTRTKNITRLLILDVLNPFTTGNPFLGTKLLGFSKGRGSGALKGLNVTILVAKCHVFFGGGFCMYFLYPPGDPGTKGLTP